MLLFIETERLILREILTTDEAGMFALDSNPEVQTYIVLLQIKNYTKSH